MSAALIMINSQVHSPYVAPLGFQTFNNHTEIVAGFYDNPFALEIAIKHFDFHFDTPTGEKLKSQNKIG